MQDILIAYGQTELSPINNMTLPDDSLERRTETVGRAMPWVEIKIIDEAGHVVPVGQKGEICTRGLSVMQGYWNDPEKLPRRLIPLDGCTRVTLPPWMRRVMCALSAASKT